MRKITNDECKYLLGFVDNEDLDLLTTDQLAKCFVGVELFIQKNTDIYEKYFERYDCTLQDLDTYYGFRHDALIKGLVSSTINDQAVVIERNSNQNYEEVKEHVKEQIKEEVIQEESSNNRILIFSEQQRIKRFLSLTPLVPNDSNAVYYKEKDEESRSFGLCIKNVVKLLFMRKSLVEVSKFYESTGISEEKIMDTFSKLLMDENGTYILVLQEPQLIRKKIYIM